MTEGNGKFEKGGGLEALRTQVVVWTEGHEDVSVEKDKRYEAEFKAIRDIVAAGREADASLVKSAFNAAERAIAKSDEATDKHFELTNSYQRQIEKLIAELATKAAVEREVQRLGEMIEGVNKEIARLRESGAATQGIKEQVLESRQQSQWSTSTVVTIVFGVGGFFIGISGIAITAAIAITAYLASR